MNISLFSAIILIVSVIFIGLLPESSHAADNEQERVSTFRVADTNHDGRLSFDEFEQAVRNILSKRESFQARGFRMMGNATQRAILQDHFKEMDSHHKGYLVLSDWHAK